MRATLILLLISTAAPCLARQTCDSATLRGNYVWNFSRTSVENGNRMEGLAVITFDGAGGLTSAVTLHGPKAVNRLVLKGSYSVTPDCRGSMSIRHANAGGQVNYDLVLMRDGKEGYAIQTDPGAQAKGFLRKR